MTDSLQSKSNINQKLKSMLQQFSPQSLFKVTQKIYPIQASIDPINNLISAMQKYTRIHFSKSITFDAICNNIWDIMNVQDQKISKAITKQIIYEILQPIRQKWSIKPQNSSTNYSYMYPYPQIYAPQYNTNPINYPSFGNYSNDFHSNFGMQYPSNYSNYNMTSYGSNQSNLNISQHTPTAFQMADNSNSAGNSYQNNQRNYQQSNSQQLSNNIINQTAMSTNILSNNIKNTHAAINNTSFSNNPANNSNNIPANINVTVNLHNSQPHQQNQNQNQNLNSQSTQNYLNSQIPNSANINTKNISQISMIKKTSNTSSNNNISNQKPVLQNNVISTTNIGPNVGISLASSTKNSKQLSTSIINNNSKTDINKVVQNNTVRKQPILDSSKGSVFDDYFHQSNYTLNLVKKHKCICGKDTNIIQKQKQQKFKCIHCQQFYHVNCQKRINNCIMCYMKFMIPTHRVKNQIFVGVLRKNKKKHQIVFQIDDPNKIKQANSIIQARCVRITESTQNINLFPDAVSVQFNKQSLKDFQPLHRQSSLKYRKDQPLSISSNLIKKANRVILIQKTAGKDNREDRIDSQNHLFGVYVVEQHTSKSLTKQISMKYLNQFNQSKNLLDNNFKLTSDQLTCQVLKIPLTCTLTTEKINIPARGIFCKHFQCFDLQNYISMISMSATPKWFCPLCKKPAYQFIIDSILTQIIKLAPLDKDVTHAMFKQDGSFQIFSKDQILKDGIRNIYDLPIESKYKRVLEAQKQVKQETDNKPKKKIKQIPLEAQIIDLSD